MDTLLPIVYLFIYLFIFFFFFWGGGVCLMSNLSCFSFFSAISNIFLKRLRFH